MSRRQIRHIFDTTLRSNLIQNSILKSKNRIDIQFWIDLLVDFDAEFYPKANVNMDLDFCIEFGIRFNPSVVLGKGTDLEYRQ